MPKATKGKRVSMSKGPNLEQRLTLEALDAISSDEDETGVEDGKDEWNAEASALRQAIAEGAFDHLLTKSKREANNQEVDFVEDEEQSDDGDRVQNDNEPDIAESDQEVNAKYEESDDDQDSSERFTSASSNGKALVAVYEDLQRTKKSTPWCESFAVIPEKPLPFGGNCADGSPLDIHDDLKRELAFYGLALEAANEARSACVKSGVSFARPDDFFAEMVKTDDHMAKVKDRLIFETKKIDAVAQRKANKEQKLLSKEKATNKLLEKSNRKKEHFKAVEDWAKTAAQNRGPALREDDNAHLTKMTNKIGWTDRDGNIQEGPNKKRMAADKKYGHGGKKGRFKQNDPKTKNDMSAFNPKGNFGGMGSKSKGKAEAQRPGKRARESMRSKR